MKRLWIMLAMFALLAGACGGDEEKGRPSGGDSTPTATATNGVGGDFSASDVSKMPLQESQAPGGLTYSAEASGPQTIDDLAEDAAEKEALEKFGFQAGHGTVFATPGVLDAQSAEDAPKDGKLVLSLAVIMKDFENAAMAVGFLSEKTKQEAQNVRNVDASALGQAAVGLTGQFEDMPYQGTMFVWANGNAVLIAMAAGPEGTVGAEHALDIAQTMQGNVKKL